MLTTNGINKFNNAIIGLDYEEKYDGIQDSITKHLQDGKCQGANDGWSNNVALIETNPKVHLLIYNYPGLIKKQMIETASQAIWTIVNNANIQHCIRYNMMYLFHHTSITDKAWNAIKKHKNHWGKEGGVDGPAFIWYLYKASKGTKSAIFNIIRKMNIFCSEHEGHDIMKINNCFEAHQDEIEKSGGKNDQLLIVLFRTYLTVTVSEFRQFVVCNKESWETEKITDPLVLMNDAESKFKSLQEDKLWVTNYPMKAKMLALTTVIGNLTRQLDSNGNIKQSNKYFVKSTSSIVAPGNNETWDAPKPGESRTKMVGKQLRTYCSKCNRGKGFWG